MAKVKLEQQLTHSVEPPQIKEEEDDVCVKPEPEEVSFHIVSVKTEGDEEECKPLQRVTEKNRLGNDGEDYGASAGGRSYQLKQFHSGSKEQIDSSDNDRSEDWVPEQRKTCRKPQKRNLETKQSYSDIEEKTDDSDDSDDLRQPQAPAKRSYAMICPDSCVTDPRRFNCSDCGKRFMWKSRLQSHMSVHTGERPFTCTVCEKDFKLKSHMTKHLKNIHHMCPVCETQFPDKFQLKEHLGCHVEEGTLDPSILKPLSCSDCFRRFTKASCLKRHMLVHTDEILHKCPVCEKGFKEKWCVTRHMRLHSEERPHVCSVCDKAYKEKCHLAEHLRRTHHICPLCNTHCSDKVTLLEHLSNHRENGTSGQLFLKSFSCSQCEKVFTSKVHLRRHMVFHTIERPFKCSVCDKGFKRKVGLKSHMIIHSGEKPFKCSVCEKSFNQKTNFQAHIKIHTGEKPFVCSVCEKGFILKCSLDVHMRTHTGERPFTCSVCDKRFTTSSSMKTHLRAHKNTFSHM